MKKLYITEEVVRALAEHGLPEFYLETFARQVKEDTKVAFEMLYAFMKLSPEKLELCYETRCPECHKQLEKYTDLLSVDLEKKCSCDDCGEFIKSYKNTYIYFRVTDDWLKWINISKEKELAKEEARRKARQKTEKHIKDRLEYVLEMFEDIPEEELSEAGENIRKHIQKYVGDYKKD